MPVTAGHPRGCGDPVCEKIAKKDQLHGKVYMVELEIKRAILCCMSFSKHKKGCKNGTYEEKKELCARIVSIGSL